MIEDLKKIHYQYAKMLGNELFDLVAHKMKEQVERVTEDVTFHINEIQMILMVVTPYYREIPILGELYDQLRDKQTKLLKTLK